jgi:DNA-binding response OmpR family regulator
MEQASRKKIETSAAGTITFATDVTVPSSAAHVLIADANARTLAACAAQLLAAGLRVSLAHTSFAAIVKASCHVPDLILLDRSLGDLNAAETGALLTTCPVTAHIPIVHLTPGRRVPQRVLAAARRQAV